MVMRFLICSIMSSAIFTYDFLVSLLVFLYSARQTSAISDRESMQSVSNLSQFSGLASSMMVSSNSWSDDIDTNGMSVSCKERRPPSVTTFMMKGLGQVLIENVLPYPVPPWMRNLLPFCDQSFVDITFIVYPSWNTRRIRRQ